VSGEAIEAALDKALDGGTGYRMITRGEADTGFAAGKGLSARYTIGAAQHRIPHRRRAIDPARATEALGPGDRASRQALAPAR
jgi:hypothetical protein